MGQNFEIVNGKRVYSNYLGREDCVSGHIVHNVISVPCSEVYGRQLCTPGSYQNEYGQTSCKPCGQTSFQNESGKSYCYVVDGGYFGIGTGFGSHTRLQEDLSN